MKKNSKNENFHQFISNPSFFYSPSFIIGTTQGQKRPITLYKNKLANKTISPKVTSCKSVDLGSTNSFLSSAAIPSILQFTNRAPVRSAPQIPTLRKSIFSRTAFRKMAPLNCISPRESPEIRQWEKSACSPTSP